MITWRGAAAAAAFLLAVGCGGGGGSGPGGAGSGGGSAPSSVLGRVSDLTGDGRISDAAGGQMITLSRIDAQGTLGSVLATTQTRQDGSYQLELPAGEALGLELAVSATSSTAGPMRALVLQGGQVDLGPASEVVTRELIAARAAFGAVLSAPPQRLATLQRNATTMLRLTSPGVQGATQAMQSLRDWLFADPAAAAAFASLRTTGTLPGSLGDIGGMLGAVRGGWELQDSAAGTRIVAMAPDQGGTGEWDLSETVAGQPQLPPSRRRIESDRVIAVSTSVADPLSQTLLFLIGPHAVGSFVLEPGVTQRLTDIDRQTNGYDFDNDGIPERLTYRIDQTSRGIEPVQAFGVAADALRIDFRTELTLTFSRGGLVSAEETLSQWSIPFAGPVRAESAVVATDLNGQVTRQSSVATAQRAVANDVSWPGRVRVQALDLAVPSNYQFPVSLGVSNELNVTFGGFVFNACCVGDNGLSTRDLMGTQPARDVVVYHDTLASKVAVSPDGSKVYVALNKAMPADVAPNVVAMDPDVAAGYAATIVRYDARTLTEEARITLPPRPSATRPGMVFPRSMAWQIIVSPIDPKTFVVAGFDAVLVQDTVVAPQSLSGFNSEVLRSDGRTRLLLDFAVVLRGWDELRNEIWIEVNGGGGSGAIVPVSTDGLDEASLRGGLPVLFTLLGLSDLSTFDRITADRAYIQGHKIVINQATGIVVRRLAANADVGLAISKCAGRGAQVLCFNGDTWYFMDADLLEMSRLPLNNDLRIRSGSLRVPPAQDSVYAPRDREIVFLGYGQAPPGTTFPAPLMAFRLSH